MHTYQVDVPAATPEGDPVVQRVKLSAGILSRLLVFFPPGCADLAHAVVFYQDHQIEPWNRDGSFHWDDYVFDIECYHEIIAPDTDVTIRAWNLDTSYLHGLTFGFQITQPPEVTTEGLLQRMLQAFVGG